jgi:hypothetical protein
MIDKQKLIKWVEDKLFVNSGPYNDVAFEQESHAQRKVRTAPYA